MGSKFSKEEVEVALLKFIENAEKRNIMSNRWVRLRGDLTLPDGKLLRNVMSALKNKNAKI